ncbi:MAG TPA: hypothetical protein VJ281_00365 [Chthoniobacterales bacterium]|jgi:hypothetical protein|nr:hypothetical protein [Chthoniobacterales bacterium]
MKRTLALAADPGQERKVRLRPGHGRKSRSRRVQIDPDRLFRGRDQAYGHVEYDIGPNYRFVRLIGRNVQTDAAGNTTVTW